MEIKDVFDITKVLIFQQITTRKVEVAVDGRMSLI